jgi:hypothetical protein
VFANPAVLVQYPLLVAYYRNLVAVSQKGMSQLGANTGRYERNPKSVLTLETALSLCQVLNKVISFVIDSAPGITLSIARDVAFAETGTELQGTWANQIGRGAAKAVEDIFARHLNKNGLGAPEGKHLFKLKNGWTIRFGNEPDVSFKDSQEVERIVIEIKGSLDKAGAQTRYGEAKKTFAKALGRNPRCHTIYLASCFTAAVVEQVRTDGQVRETFNLTSILYDQAEQNRFLHKVFHVINAPV